MNYLYQNSKTEKSSYKIKLFQLNNKNNQYNKILINFQNKIPLKAIFKKQTEL